MYETFRLDFWVGGLCQLLAASLQVMASFTLRFLITFFKEAYEAKRSGRDGPSAAIGMAYVIGISVMQIILSFGLSHFNSRSMLVGGASRSALIALMLEKSLKLSTRAKAGGKPGEESQMMVIGAGGSPIGIPWRSDPQGWSNGRIMNRKLPGPAVISCLELTSLPHSSVISTDASRIQQACDAFHLSWTSPVQIILTVALLLVNLGYSALAGVAILVGGLATLTKVMKFFMRRRSAINVQTDQRVSLTQEMLQGVRFVKYFGLERFFLSKLKPVRAQETRALRSMHIAKSAIEAGSMALPIFSNMAAFIVYSVTSHDLEPATVFSSLALFNGLRTPMNFLPVALGFIADASTSIKRIESFLLAEEALEYNDAEDNMSDAIELRSASFTWENPGNPFNEDNEKSLPESRAAKTPCGTGKPLDRAANLSQEEAEMEKLEQVFRLDDISLKVSRGELVAIIGNVGCGKTSLLSALAGEMRQVGGKLTLGDNRAY